MNCASLTSDNVSIVKYRKILKISPSKFKPPKLVMQKPSVKSPLQILAPQGLYLENCPQIHIKTKQKR